MFGLPYNPHYSACFFSRNCVFLSQQLSQNSVFQPIQPNFSKPNGTNIVYMSITSLATNNGYQRKEFPAATILALDRRGLPVADACWMDKRQRNYCSEQQFSQPNMMLGII